MPRQGEAGTASGLGEPAVEATRRLLLPPSEVRDMFGDPDITFSANRGSASAEPITEHVRENEPRGILQHIGRTIRRHQGEA